jgi:hypothetical protein
LAIELNAAPMARAIPAARCLVGFLRGQGPGLDLPAAAFPPDALQVTFDQRGEMLLDRSAEHEMTAPAQQLEGPANLSVFLSQLGHSLGVHFPSSAAHRTRLPPGQLVRFLPV